MAIPFRNKYHFTQGQCRNHGFTLIEIMMVLVIASIIFVSAIVLMPASSQKISEQELQRFNALLSIVHDRAMLEANPYGVAVWSQGYTFYRLKNNWDWDEILSDTLLKQQTWPEGQWAELMLDGIKVNLVRKKNVTKPQIYFFPDGNTTPFLMSLGEGVDGMTTLQFNADGQGEVFAAQE